MPVRSKTEQLVRRSVRERRVGVYWDGLTNKSSRSDVIVKQRWKNIEGYRASCGVPINISRNNKGRSRAFQVKIDAISLKSRTSNVGGNLVLNNGARRTRRQLVYHDRMGW